MRHKSCQVQHNLQNAAFLSCTAKYELGHCLLPVEAHFPLSTPARATLLAKECHKAAEGPSLLSTALLLS